MPRVAAQDAPRSQPTAPCRPMTPDRLDRVVAATGEVPAIGADHRPDRPLVGAHKADRELSSWAHATPALASARRRSSCKATKLRARVASRPISTRSTPETGCSIQHQSRSLLQPTAGSIANHGVADLLGDGKPKPRRTMILSRQCLHHHAGRRCLASFGRGTQEFGATCQAARAGQVRPPIRPTSACGPWSAGWPALCGLRRWPCGRGNHAAACGPASTVDRCASQPVLR